MFIKQELSETQQKFIVKSLPKANILKIFKPFKGENLFILNIRCKIWCILNGSKDLEIITTLSKSSNKPLAAYIIKGA